MSDPRFVQARFKRLDGKGEFPVHFNPTSLQYQISANTAQQGSDRGGGEQQFTGLSLGKLTMDLVFDTTHDGSDVRVMTTQVSKLMEPQSRTNRTPTKVEFSWGVYVFTGFVESYRETIDFFAPSGVPLRAAVNLVLATDANVFDPKTAEKPTDWQKSLSLDEPRPEPVRVPEPRGGAARVAQLAGDPRAARALAQANGLESLRFGQGGGMSVPVGRGGALARLDPGRLLPAPPTAGLPAGAGATFGVGGRAQGTSGGSLNADVGAGASLRERIRFGEG